MFEKQASERDRRHFSLASSNLPPGSLGEPIFGESREFVVDPVGFVWERYHKYGPTFKTFVGYPTVFMIGPDANKFILKDQTEFFSWGQGWPKFVKLLWGEETLNMKDGDDYLRLRQLIAPAFSHDYLVDAVKSVWKSADGYLNEWTGKGVIEFFPQAKKVIFDWVQAWLAGLPKDPNQKQAFINSYDTFTVIPKIRLGDCSELTDRNATQKHFREKFLAKMHLKRYLDNIVTRRRSHPTGDVLSAWTQTKDKQCTGLTNDQISDHCLLFMVAGGDSTASMFTWMVLALARHPEVKDRLRKEIDTVLGLEDLTWEHIRKLRYLSCFMKEVERMYPTQLGGIRKVVKPFDFNGHNVPKNWYVRMCTFASHNLPAIFADPEKFDPDRFAPPREEDQRTPFSLIGFGAGQRQCTGKSLALAMLQSMIVKMVRDYDWILADDQDLSPMLYNRAVFVPRSSLIVEFMERSKTIEEGAWLLSSNEK